MELPQARVDVRLALRALRRAPAFTASVIAMLTLGIGASTAIFTVVGAILMRPLPYPAAERLFVLQSTSATADQPFGVAPGVFHDWRERVNSFDLIGGADARVASVAVAGGEPQSRATARASAAFFQALGVTPQLGRLFVEHDEVARASDVVIVEEAFWRTHLGSRPDVIGQRLQLDSAFATVVGVVKTDFRFRSHAPELWTPLPPRPNARAGGSVIVLARLKQGTTPDAASAQLHAVHEGIRGEQPADRRFGVTMTPLRDWVVGSSRQGLIILSGAVGLLLLICCSNVAGLMLIRVARRQKEFAIKTSLGSGRARLAAETLIEATVVCVVSACVGAWLATALVTLVPAIDSIVVPRAEEIRVDWSMLGVGAIVTGVTVVICGLLPAMRAARADVRQLLQTSDAVGNWRGVWIRHALVASQVAIAVVLLTGATLVTRTLYNLFTEDTGFDPTRLAIMQVGLPGTPNPARDRLLHAQLLEHVTSVPGVDEVTSADQPPLTPVLYPYTLRSQRTRASEGIEVLARHVGPAYFATLRIKLLSGRDFVAEDASGASLPVVLNRAAATALFGGDSASVVGETLEHNYTTRPPFEVLGIVDDVRQLGVRVAAGPQVYVPSAFSFSRRSYVIARIAPGVQLPSASLRAAARQLGPELSVSEVTTVENVIGRELAEPRFYVTLLGFFAFFAVLLTALGVYAAAAFTVSARTKELAVRASLGARPTDIVSLVVTGSVVWTLIGVAIGVITAVGATRVVEHLLYDVDAQDPATLLTAAGLLAMMAFAAAYIPARRTARQEPIVALRAE